MFKQVTTLGAYGGPNPLTFYGVPFMSELNFRLQLAGPTSSLFAPPLPVQRCQVSDEGLSVVVQILDSAGNPVDLRGASSTRVIVVRPSGASVETNSEFYTNGLDGKIVLVTGTSTPYGTGIDEPGIWQIQGRITIDGSTQFTEVSAFSVYSNLGA